MTDIPQDVMEKAWEVVSSLYKTEALMNSDIQKASWMATAAAKAIMAEREACANLVAAANIPLKEMKRLTTAIRKGEHHDKS